MSALVSGAELRDLERRGMAFEVFGIAYNLAEGVIAVLAGLIAGSVALIGFGFDSAIEVSASFVVLWHLARRTDAEPEWEHRVATYVGLTFLALAAYVGIRALRDLATESRPDASWAGIALAVASLVIMPVLARLKHDLAHRIESRALEAESRETLICSYLSATLLLGLGANAVLGWWWADPVAALVMTAFVAKEGWEAFSRKELCCVD